MMRPDPRAAGNDGQLALQLLHTPSDSRLNSSCPDGSDSVGLEDNGGSSWLRGDPAAAQRQRWRRPTQCSARVELPGSTSCVHSYSAGSSWKGE
ncbi:unnamed protein product [Urochloa humidicola]